MDDIKSWNSKELLEMSFLQSQKKNLKGKK